MTPLGKAALDRRVGGMTLIEVLVTLVLISVGLLGVAALHLTSLKGNKESYVRTQASVLAADILDRMRANQAGFIRGEYAAALNGTGTAGTVAEQDLQAWQGAIDQILPGGPANAGGTVTIAGNIATITLQWSERADAATLDAGGAANGAVTFQVRSEI